MKAKNELIQDQWIELGEWKGLCIPQWRQQGVENCFTTRWGGTSLAPYSSLNVGLHVEDDAKKVQQNRKILAQKLAISPQQMVFCEQVHGVEVQKVSAKHRGQGVFSYEEAIPHTDALITNEEQVYLTLLFADCIPLFFFDPKARAVGLAHGGWKGAWGEIGAATVQAMQENFGCQPEHIQCWIGPGIGPCCFQISADLAEQVQSRNGWEKDVTCNEEGKWVWDLKQTHRRTLFEQGILPINLAISQHCTSCHPQEFFSYRRDQGKTGRMAAVLGLRGA